MCWDIDCADGDGCIGEEDFCDGKEDCNDGSDEATCDGLFELCNMYKPLIDILY